MVGGLLLKWDGAVLHHLVTDSGDVVELLIQSFNTNPPSDFTLVLGCRDGAFGELLSKAHLERPALPGQADPTDIRQAIVNFWIGSHKHSKVLLRNLDMLALVGLGMESTVLIRLWFLEDTGLDEKAQGSTIHALTHAVRAVMNGPGSHRLEILGAERRTRAELIRVIKLNRAEVSRVEKLMADRLGFDYPEALEQVVNQTWQKFLTN